MDKGLIDYLVELEIDCESIIKAKSKIESNLNYLLSAHDKNFEVIFNGKTYDFYLASTKEEADELSVVRKELIDQLVNVSFKTGNWDFVLAFASGVDPLDMQCEIIKREDIYDVADENGNIVTALPLNEEAHVVKTQRLKEEDAEQDKIMDQI